ncbi:MAG: alanine/ornithine racemase family PLP-dependent enzyme [Bacteroidetes bacterium]|nr:alanine/ornithine racemase family PLP-dependent enzyme [Bacteroidota bacterium]MCH8523125.1 alanine/ornithine racemase family PLP-dependent enzyme [Balneolales bacterium]
MAYLKLYRDRLKHNYNHLKKVFGDKDVSWGVVTKLFCGNELFIREIADLGIKEMHDSRISNLKAIKRIDPSIQTVYIKPPPRHSIKNIIKYADVSFNTEFETIKLLSDEAVLQDKTHKIIIMIEMGDLREGVMRDELVEFYARVYNLPNVKIVGIGTNLNCLHGVMPSSDKLIQLSLYKQIIELKLGITIPWVSGGTTVTLPLLIRGDLPSGINHFRVGEALYFGADLFSGATIEGMRDDILRLYTEIIEIHEKPVVPSGDIGADPMGNIMTIDESLIGQTSTRAIVDVGQLDINPDFLIPESSDVKVVDASSDMLVLDVADNKRNLKVGDMISFNVKYMGALGIMNSRYIDKVVE